METKHWHLEKTQYLRLDARISKHGRVVLMGKTYEEDKIFRWDNLMVLRRLGFLSTETEARERRFKDLQAMVR